MTTVLLTMLLLAQGAGPATASLAGRVLDGDSRTPIAGARVTVIGQAFRQDVTTDHEGRFRFAPLAAGSYRVIAEQAGFIPSPMAAAGPTAAGGTITLTGPTSGVELLLYRGGVITGQVFDEQGTPLARVGMQALRRAAATGTSGLQGPPVLTNDLGEFRIASLMAGDYVVLATPPRGPLRDGRTLVPTYYPSTPDLQTATILTLRPAETAMAVAITIVSAPAYEIAGVVIDEQGRPRAGVLITVLVQQTGGQMAMQASARATTAGPDGTFRIGGLAPGTYRLAVSDAAPGQSPPASPLDAIQGLLSTLTGGGGPLTTVEIRDQSISGVRLVVPPAR